MGSFPDLSACGVPTQAGGNSALMLVASRLRHIAGSRWGLKQYLKIERISELEKKQVLA